MRIALLGTRGIPASYGGFETFAEELSVRLAAKGHRVTVYSRAPHTSLTYRGVHVQYVPTIRHKYFDTLSHTFLSTVHLVRRREDRAEVALYCNAANAVFTLLPRIFGIPVVLNVDGIERKRRKWNALARAWYLLSEWLATWCPSVFVTDAEAIREYYRVRYAADSLFIPYGASVVREESQEVLTELGLRPREYFLYVSRMEPENRALEVRMAFEQVPTNMRLALVGDAPYAQDYIAQVRETRDPRVVIPGAIYGSGYRELGSWCFAYIHATEVGGTHPALIEAMGRGALVLYLDNLENREVCGDAGLAYTDHEGLIARMRETLAMSEVQRNIYRERARERVRLHYDWNAVTEQYERLLLSRLVNLHKV